MKRMGGELLAAAILVLGIALSAVAYTLLDNDRNMQLNRELEGIADRLGKELDARLSRISEIVRVSTWLFHANVNQLDVTNRAMHPCPWADIFQKCISEESCETEW